MDNQAHPNTPCQPQTALMRTRPNAQTWLRAKWALQVLAKMPTDDAESLVVASRHATDAQEAGEALEAVSVHMATDGRHLAAFCALGAAQALRGRFIFRDLPGAAKIALRAFPFFASRTCVAEGLTVEVKHAD